MATREFDLVLYGATGFVGALTAAHLARQAEDNVRIALAGRSRDKLESLRTELGPRAEGWELIAVDASDSEGLRRMAARATAITSTVGPYARYGKELVSACADEGTHYADLTGEVLFVRWSLDEVAARAADTGARIVHACGFDSIPSDLGVYVTAEKVGRDGAGTLRDTTLAVRSLRGGISGGTIDSLRQQAITMNSDAEARRLVSDPYGLSPRRSEEPATPPPSNEGVLTRVKRWIPVGRDAVTGRWTGPFVMSAYNKRIVRMSNTLTDWSYGRGFQYREVIDFGTGLLAPVKAGVTTVGLGLVMGALAWGPTRALLDKVLPKPGDGPTAKQRAAGRFRLEIRTTTSTGAHYQTDVGADYDPGYNGTAIMLGETALSLALDGGRLPARAGVLTPATAMGSVLVERLRAHGFTFEAARAE